MGRSAHARALSAGTESLENERKVRVTTHAIGLMVHVSSTVSFAVLGAPELLARARCASPRALRTRGLDRHLGLRLRRRRMTSTDSARRARLPPLPSPKEAARVPWGCECRSRSSLRRDRTPAERCSARRCRPGHARPRERANGPVRVREPELLQLEPHVHAQARDRRLQEGVSRPRPRTPRLRNRDLRWRQAARRAREPSALARCDAWAKASCNARSANSVKSTPTTKM